ncbi:biopolymer transporter ExbD [Luteolibacter sp. SL250]|uniref:ExbD/TolR family protein n=1 Tax=Luteolibacter sp. SL250 TaxID=2995170 RepID=UPI0022705043|nr:biopolymer transporter ExbD [Luteolibacter sp. SL250]WAC19775.1 biopolymer transporter ExbD [Luteolibacter sp. SL250]
MGGGGGGGDGEPEFQIAPMIDVLLVLLVFFVVITSAEVLKVDKGLTLPVSPNAKERDPEMAKSEMAINVRWDQGTNKGVLVVDDKVYDNWEELVPYLEARNKSNQETRGTSVRVVVRGDKGLPAGEIQRIMNVIGMAGIADIAFSASNR